MTDTGFRYAMVVDKETEEITQLWKGNTPGLPLETDRVMVVEIQKKTYDYLLLPKYYKMKLQEVVGKLTMIACGPSNSKCKCECATGGSCEHKWDGPEKTDGNLSTATCSRCGLSAMEHDLWVCP